MLGPALILAGGVAAAAEMGRVTQIAGGALAYDQSPLGPFPANPPQINVRLVHLPAGVPLAAALDVAAISSVVVVDGSLTTGAPYAVPGEQLPAGSAALGLIDAWADADQGALLSVSYVTRALTSKGGTVGVGPPATPCGAMPAALMGGGTCPQETFAHITSAAECQAAARATLPGMAEVTVQVLEETFFGIPVPVDGQ